MSTRMDSVGEGFSLNHGPNAHPYHYVHPQHHHGGKKNSGSGGSKSSIGGLGAPPSISLVISPNLDALLAHEERLRSARPQTPESTRSGGGGSVDVTSPVAVAGAGDGTPVERGNSEEEGGPVGLPPPPRRTGRGTAGPKSPLQTGRRAVAAVAVAAGAESPAESPRVTPEREMEENPYINRAPTLEDVLQSAGSEGGSRDVLGVKGRRGRVPSAIDPRTLTMTTSEGGRRRPLLSHGPAASVSSMESGGSTGPASTAENEPRISISSTVYAASSTHSLPHSFYNSDRASFIDLYSPRTDHFSDPDPSPITFAAPHSPKPPLPTTPKPVFPRQMPLDERPPTTNFLDMGERADLIRKTRKLARVFGQTPGADAMAQQDANRAPAPIHPASAALALVDSAHRDPSYSRRHSMPLSPDDVSFLSPRLDAFPRPPPARISSLVFPRPESPTSFIDLSDDEYAAAKGNTPAGPGAPVLRSKMSIDTLASDDLAEEERRRKRERLAKLHRFLGSRVPAHLVLGTADPADLASLPLPQASSEEDSTGSRKTWLKRRRSSSAVILPSFRLDDLERVKEELDDKEKAINVRRAHKMEKVFGVAPPQTLYHTRHCPTPRPLSSGDPTASSNSGTGASTPSSFLGALPIIPASQSRTAAANNATNRTAYLPKVRTKTKKGGRPGTAESSKQLLPKDDVADGPATANANLTPVDPRHSFVYSHYQHSLNSLNDILDRDDRASLVELHEYLNSTDIPTPTLANPMLLPRLDSSGRPSDYLDDLDGTTASNVDTLAGALERRLSLASLKSERRRSLPARTSMISLASSEISVALAGVDAMDFQQRRKRAAKLTQFFGVNYRELITDVLDSIENGVAHEGARGTLKAEEVEDLLTKLRTLKTKRASLFS